MCPGRKEAVYKTTLVAGPHFANPELCPKSMDTDTHAYMHITKMIHSSSFSQTMSTLLF